MTRILEETVQREVERLCREGDEHAKAGEHGEALDCFVAAWERLPEPRESYLETAAVFRGFTRVLRARGELGAGLDLLLSARHHFAPVLAAMGWWPEE